MKQYAVIGVSSFGKRILNELLRLDCEIILIDKNPEVIEYFKNDVAAAYIANVINEEIVFRLIPADIDAAVIDLGDRIEASILVTQYLSKIGVANIIVKAETDQHGEILSIVGADHVVYPDLEAARRVIPVLASDLLFHYLPISKELVIAETGMPSDLIGHTLLETDIRQAKGINVLAFRRSGRKDYQIPNAEYRFQKEDVLLVIGREDDTALFTGKEPGDRKRNISDLLHHFFGKKNRRPSVPRSDNTQVSDT